MFEFSRLALPSVDLPLDFSMDFPGSLDSVTGFITQLQGAIASAIQHPFLAILALLVGIGLLQLIADLVKRILKASIAFTLTLPLNLSQWIWKRATTSSKASKESQIEQLIDQLEILRAEETEIINELKELLSSPPTSPAKTTPPALLTSLANQVSRKTAKQITEQSGEQTAEQTAEQTGEQTAKTEAITANETASES